MFFVDYIYWHFAVAPRGIFELLSNYMTATWHRFLIVQHFKTLLSPWHRRKPSDISGKSDIGTKMIEGVIDFYIRIIAAFMRTTIILVGLLFEVVIFIFFFIVFAVWVLWPLVLGFCVIFGISLII